MNIKRKAADIIVSYRLWFMIVMIMAAVFGMFMIGKTKINYDLNRYLSEETMTKRALKIMNEEFGSNEQLRLMFSDLSEEKLDEILDELSSMEEVRLASHDPETDVRIEVNGNEGGAVQISDEAGENLQVDEGGAVRYDGVGVRKWQLITLTLNDCGATATAARLRKEFPDVGTYYVGGSAAEQLDAQNSVAKEIPQVMLISVGIVLTVLFITSHAWLEPLVILISLAIAILINMGTNFIFPDVSFITFAVCAILQLALSIDYAIMLIHTYNAYCDEGMNAKEAMKEALSQCFMRITSSAVTTVAGLLSLLFMSFRIGFDIGIVLSKGIIISLLGVFLFMPALLTVGDRWIIHVKH